MIQGYGGRIDIVSAKGNNQEQSENQDVLESNDVAKKPIDSKDNKEQSIDDKSDNLNEEDIPF